MLDTVLRSIFREGAIAARGPDGKLHCVRCTEADAPVIVRIHDYATLRRIARRPGLAAGEAYMDGGLTIERGTLYDVLAKYEGEGGADDGGAEGRASEVWTGEAGGAAGDAGGRGR